MDAETTKTLTSSLFSAMFAAAAKANPNSPTLDIKVGPTYEWLREYFSGFDMPDEYRAAEHCESPIEVLALFGVYASFHKAKFPVSVLAPGIAFSQHDIPDREVLVEIIVQEPLDRFRCDIGIHISACVQNKQHYWHIALECDGWAYHSSPEQMQRDGERAQILSNLGAKVIRFDGHQIWGHFEQLCSENIVQPYLEKCSYLARSSW